MVSSGVIMNLGILCQVNASISDLLLNFDGANNTNLFIDDSSSHHTMVTVGTPIQFDGQGVFDGNGYLYTDTLPKFLDKDFVITGKFSIQGWPSGFNNPAIFGYKHDRGVGQIGLLIGGAVGGLGYKKLAFMTRDEIATTHYIVHQDDITLNVEHEFKAERLNGVVRLFVDDVEAVSSYAIGSALICDNSDRFCVGGSGAFIELFVGAIDELNVVLTP